MEEITSYVTTLQERFWAFDQFSPTTPVHNVAATIRTAKRLSVRVIDQALQDLVARHEALRTHFLVEDGLPAPNLAAPTRIRVEQAEALDTAEAARLVREHACASFNLVKGPLLRMLHVRLQEESCLSLVVHRIVADYQSLALLITELAELYEARLAGRGLPQVAQSSLLVLGDKGHPLPSDELRSVLQEELAGAQLESNLPLMRARPTVPTYRGLHHTFQIPQQLAKQACALAQQEKVAAATIFLAAFRAMLHRYSWEDDFVVGVELDRRTQSDVIGPYADLILVPSHRTPDNTFRDLVRAAHCRLDKAAARPPAPLTLLAQLLQQRLDVGQVTLCKVAFALRPALPNPQVGEVEWTCELTDVAATEFDLELVLTGSEAGEDMRADLVYNADLLSPQIVEAIAGHYVRILESALASPDRCLYLLDMLTEADLKILLEEWNNFPQKHSTERPIYQMFEEQTALRPNALAFSQGEVKLSYGELNGRANQLAWLLRERGACPETVITLSMERSWEWLVAALAVLKSGAALMMLDPRTPGTTHETIFGPNPPLLLLSLKKLDVTWPFASDQIIYLDRDWPEIAKRDKNNLGVWVDPDNLAIIVLTSGTTGAPKLVGILHRKLTHLVTHKADLWGVTPETRTSWLAPTGVAVELLQIWPCLCSGASLHTVDPEVILSISGLRDWLAQEQITEVYLVASLAELLLSLDWPGDCALQLLGRAGEKVQSWGQESLPFEVFVEYGTTEAGAIASSLQPWEQRLTSATASPQDRLSPPPLGRPWPGVHVYVVDPDINLMPPGVVGELYIDSPLMARGYLNDPALTALKFVPNPFPGAPGSRLYRTGDLVRQHDTGLLDHHGRVDTQLKVRGYRIEASEVEKVLLDHPKIADAAVVTMPDPEGQPQLVAYLVARGLIGAAELRTFASERLSSYKVPSAYTFMPRLPRNLGNKVDRRALPAPDWGSARERLPHQSPRNEVEEVLVALWSETLHITDPGISDNFFDLGGNSLSASRLVAKVRERLGVEIALRDLFLSPTPAALALRIQEANKPVRRRELPQVLPSRKRAGN